MKIIIVSKEKVKPSKPAPSDFKKHKLCLFDQLACEICITPIFFYKKPFSKKNSNNHHLKNSLSKTLTLFYPLAGELSPNDITFVNCNDNGVLYVEARVEKDRLDEFLRNPDLSELIKFLPQNGSMGSKMKDVQILETLVSIQVTRFDCGGVAIGGVFLHKLLDGDTMSKFFNTWAKIVRDDGVEKIESLDFTSSSRLFPPQKDSPDQMIMETKNMIFSYKGESLVRRFVFSAKAIEAIKKKVSSEEVADPTPVEALTTFIWKHMILATRRVKGSSTRKFMVAHLVNLRSRIDSKLPNAFGNLVFVAYSEAIGMSHHEMELRLLGGIVKKMFENVKNSKNLKALEGAGGFDCIVDMTTNVGNLLPQLDTYMFSSWCNFGLYDVNFGGGKPIFVVPFIGPIGSSNKPQIILVKNGKNDGIEAWILRSKEEMLELEKDKGFLEYASPNPSIQCDP